MRNLQIFFSWMVFLTIFMWCLLTAQFSLASDASHTLVTIHDILNFDKVKFEKAIISALNINEDAVFTIESGYGTDDESIVCILKDAGVRPGNIIITKSEKMYTGEAKVMVSACCAENGSN